MKSSDYWKQVQGLFEQAIAKLPPERSAFLAAIPDTAIRQEVCSLLDFHTHQADDPIEQGVRKAARDWAAHSTIESSAASSHYSSPPGESRFQPGELIDERYKIVGLLEVGGMGEVYRAQDLRLGQPVALKFLPPAAAAKESQRNRLYQEVRLARQVSHPNVCRVYDLGEVDGCPYISMEYVDGENLGSLLRRIGRLPADKALDFAHQLSTGLAAAHDRGILHRDLKPANVMIDGRGQVVIADFGLAGAVGTINGREIQNGTPAYMAPEQLAGISVSVRSDIYSLGLIIHEMFTGQRVFEDGTRHRQPSKIADLAKDIPPRVEQVVHHCLATDPGRRPASAHDVLRALPPADVRPSSARSLIAATLPARTDFFSSRASLAFVLGTAVLLTLAFLIPWRRRSASLFADQLSLKREVLETPVTRYDGYEFQPSLSPDGNEVAFAWNSTGDNYSIFVKLLEGDDSLRLTNSPAHDLHPTFSPDGHTIAFIRLYPDNRKDVFTVSALGGPEHFLAHNHASRPAWAPNASLLRDHFPGPVWSPKGSYLAISDRSSEDQLDSIFFISIATGERRQVSRPAPHDVGDYLPCFSPDGKYLAFIRTSSIESGSDVYIQPVDASSPAKRITFKNVAIDGLTWVSKTGLAFAAELNIEDGPRLWSVNTKGSEPTVVSGVRGDIGDLNASLNGRILVYSEGFRNSNIWRMPIGSEAAQNSEPVRLIASSTKNDSASYSPDGKRIVFVSNRGKPAIRTALADGTHIVAIASPLDRSIGSPHWSPDGQTIVFDADLNKHSIIETVSSEGGPAKIFISDPCCEYVMPTWSRDGRYIYYSVGRGGTDLQIWKKSVDGGAPIQITWHGGGDRAESLDGRTLYYDRNPGLWRVPVSGGPEEPVPGLATTPVDRLFAIGNAGLYYLSAEHEPWNVHLLNPSTGHRAIVGTIRHNPEFWTPSLAVSPNGKFILYTQTDQSGADLMMLRNFQ